MPCLRCLLIATPLFFFITPPYFRFERSGSAMLPLLLLIIMFSLLIRYDATISAVVTRYLRALTPLRRCCHAFFFFDYDAAAMIFSLLRFSRRYFAAMLMLRQRRCFTITRRAALPRCRFSRYFHAIDELLSPC